MPTQATATQLPPPRRILITGANSYIGQSFEAWATKQHPRQFLIDTLDMQDPNWRQHKFDTYDTVFHVAGIAHADIGHVTEERKNQYYKVNADLAKETAQIAKAAQVKQFVFMSSIIIYGEAAGINQKRVITRDTIPTPANFYGDSKWQGDQAVQAEETPTFKTAIIRPPMIYGKNSKGNYPTLSKLAQKLPLFPSITNERSMLHIDNLCEFLSLLMMSGEGGIFFPQNRELVGTKEMVQLIAHEHGKTIHLTPLFNWAVKLLAFLPGKPKQLINKAFGNLSYDLNMSKSVFGDYQIRNLAESIHLTEGINT